MKLDTESFLALVRGGLWEKDIRLSPIGMINCADVMRLAEEQSVIGLVTAGLEHVKDVKIPKEEILQFVGMTLQLEERNNAMNRFIADLVEKLRKADIYTLLVKGQGIAQCYERPLWRCSGDIDLYLSKSNYERAKATLAQLSKYLDNEDKRRLHYGMTIDQWTVELHGTLHTWISNRMNSVSDEVHHDIFFNGNVRSWNNNGVTVFLPDANSDIIIIFNHFINHFYGEGIGLRQICDWCRLLWEYNNEIDTHLLKKRLRRMELMGEWKAFGTLAVEYLGMPSEAMPFYDNQSKYKTKAKKLLDLIIETGNFGYNKDNSYRGKYSKFIEYYMTLIRRMGEFRRIFSIFPVNSVRFFLSYLFNRVKVIV